MNLVADFVAFSQPFPWRKKGLVFAPQGDEFSHASHPCAIHIGGNEFLIAFSRRDSKQRSHIFLVTAYVSEGQVEMVGTPTLALAPGAAGHFDCDGVISTCFVLHQGSIYLYYVGWQNLPEGLWCCDTGRVRLNKKTLTLVREFQGPVLGRNKNNPLFAAATAFHVSGDLWQTWYNSGVRWERSSEGWKHIYGIYYAHSPNGVDWICHPGMCLPFADEYEYAFGRPTVIHREDTYLMWYAHRATATIDSYRIGFAMSVDGQKWERKDSLAGIDVSPSGWDSEMICYPSVFEHKGLLYMLYNGNDYGKTGFGLAVLGEEL